MPQKAKPLNMIKELNTIRQRTDVVAPPVEVIDERIEEYATRQNTKEYLNSFLCMRRELELKFDEGYRICKQTKAQQALEQQKLMLASTQNGPEQKDASVAVDLLHRVPSQKLSTYIRRRNQALRRERRLREREALLKSQDSSEEVN